MLNKYIDFALFGCLLKYHREKKNISRERFIHMMKKRNKSNSCSYITLRRIEDGIPSASLCFYNEISNALGFIFCNDTSIYNELTEYIEALYRSINADIPIETLDRMKEKIILFHQKHENEIYLSEVSRILIVFLDIYLTNKTNDHGLIDILESTFFIMNEPLKTISCFILYIRNLVRSENDIKFKDYSFLGKTLVGKRIFVLHEIYYDLSTINSFDLYSKYRKMNESTEYIEKKVYKFSVLSGLACTELNLHGYVNAHNHLCSALNIDDISSLLPKHVFTNTLKRFGIIEYQMANYLESFKSLLTVYEKDNHILGMNYLLLFKAAELTNNISKIQSLLNKEADEIQDIMVQNLFNYFDAKYNQNAAPEILENIFCECFHDSKVDSEIHANIFKEELIELINQTKHYKYLYKYLQS